MKYLAIGVGLFIVAALGAIFIIPSLVPAETYRARIQEQLSQELGRDVELLGDVSLSTFPALKAKVDGVRIANPNGFSRDNFAALDGLDARIRLLPLLSKRVEISRFVLRSPDIALERRADGQVNWAFNADSAADDNGGTDAKTPEGPFRRDGRYTNFDPNIRAFQIIDGNISYADRQAGTEYTITDVNSFLSLPSLAQPLLIEGTLRVDDRPVAIDMTMDNLREILNGRAGTVKGEFQFGDIALSLDGEIPAGSDLAFRGDFSIDADDLAVLEPYLADPAALRAISSGSANGLIDASAQNITLSDTRLTASGPAGQADFAGSAAFAIPAAGASMSTPSANGTLDLDLTDIQNLVSLLPEDIDGIEQITTLALQTELQSEAGSNRLSAKSIDATFSGPNFEAAFKGAGEYDGTARANGTFDVSARNIAALLDAAKIEAPDGVNLVQTVTATGNLDYAQPAATLTDLDAAVTGPDLSASYKGELRYADGATLNGRFEANAADMSAVNAAMAKPIPYANAIGSVTLSGKAVGPQDNLSLTELTAQLRNGAVNGDFTGSATLSDQAQLDGSLEIYGESLRNVMDFADGASALPPSTQAGTIFGPFRLSGEVSGAPQDLSFKQANLALDALSGAGQFGLSLAGDRPVISGQLALQGLDLRPYMAAYSAQAPEGGIQPWSEEPLAIDGLRAADGKLSLTTPSVDLTRVSLGATTLNASLEQGRLKADIPTLSLYGGRGQAEAVLNVSGEVPSVSLQASLDKLDSKGFLSALAGFTHADGTAATQISIQGQGLTQAAIMQSLSGGGDFKVIDGVIAGIDAAEFLTGLDQALQTRALPSGIGPTEATKFRDLLGRFSLTNGVATIEDFNLSGLGFAADGRGEIDLGAQTIDFRFRPKRTADGASGLSAFGIPLRMSGSFNSAKPSLDTAFLGEIAAARAKAEAQSLIEREVGGTVGGIIGSVLGGGNGTADVDEKPAVPAEAQTETQTETQSDTRTDEEVVTDALKGLFGRKRKKDEKN